MPPVLNVSFLKLSRCAEEEVLAHKVRLGVDERHRILKLIAETKSARRLMVSASRPQTARERLVYEPAVREHVEGLVGRFHLHRAQRVLPVLPHRFERATCGSRTSEAMDQVSSVIGVSPDAEPENDLA